MFPNESFNKHADIFEKSEINLPRPVRFWLLLLLLVPSIICSLFLLFHLSCNKTLRNQLANHFIIILLIMGLVIELTNISFHLSFLNLGFVQPSTPALCLIWWFVDLGLISGCSIIMAWGSVQRYLLIFHSRLFLNKNKRLMFHYFPFITLLVYIIIFYMKAVVFPSCVNTYDYMLPVCNDYPCYLNDSLLGTWDSIINNIVPIFIIGTFSLILVIRVYYQKQRLNQPHIWRKQRKMAIHLLCTSVLYLIPNLPLNIFFFADLCGLSRDVSVQAQLYFNFLSYFVVLLYPFLCIGLLSEVRKNIKWRGLLLLKQPRQVAIVKPQ